MNKTIGTILLAGLILAPHAAQATNGYFSHGFGTRNKALAGAGVAYPLDAMGAAINPALMAHVGSRYDVGAALFSPTRGFTANQPSATPDGVPFIPVGSYESENDIFFIPHFGYNRMLDDKSSIGISLGGNGGMNTEYDSAVFSNFAAPGTTSSPTGIDMAQLFLGLSYARTFSPGYTAGIAPILSAQRIKIEGLEPFKALSVRPDKVTNNGYDYSYGGGVKVGLYAQPNDSFSLGVSYQSRLWMSRFDDYSGLFAENGDFDIPPVLQVGGAWHIRPELTLLFDVQKIFFSEVKSVANANGIVLGAGSLGGDDGLGFGWVDQTIYKFGLDWQITEDWGMQLGYSIANEVLPGGQALFNILAPATVTKHVTLGFTKKINDKSSFNVAYMHAFEREISGTNPNTPFQSGHLEMSQNEVEMSWSHLF